MEKETRPIAAFLDEIEAKLKEENSSSSRKDPHSKIHVKLNLDESIINNDSKKNFKSFLFFFF